MRMRFGEGNGACSDHALEGVLGLFERAHAVGLKGLTVFPADSPMGRILVADRACDGIACQVG